MNGPASQEIEVNWTRVGAVIAISVLAGFLVWLLVRGDDSDQPESPATSATTPDELVAMAGDLGHPIYWAGSQEGAQLDASRDGDRVLVRYLTGGAQPGDPSAQFLTVGTYPVADAEEGLKELAKSEPSLHASTPDGGYVVTLESRPTNVYLAFPGEDLQIEVYDPDATRAFKLATSGDITPVE